MKGALPLMRIDLVFPVLPPVLNGIGDYTEQLARALSAKGCAVRILTAQEHCEVGGDVEVEQAFSVDAWFGSFSLLDAVRAAPPDFLILQYEQFAYGRYGWNPALPMVLRSIKSKISETGIATMFHEDFVPITGWKNAVMTTWQRGQFLALGRLSDVVGFSVQPWVRQYESWFPRTEVAHWPVGSNIPEVGISRSAAREQFGLDESTFVVGTFGSLRAGKLKSWICDSVRALGQRRDDVLLFHVGPGGEALREAAPDLDVFDAGVRPPEEVSSGFSAMDIQLAPFVDGASTRRGSFLAGLQHGVPTVSTRGALTDSIVLEQDGNACTLTPVDDKAAFRRAVLDLEASPEDRRAMGAQARRFFDAHFRWDRIADRILSTLDSTVPQSPTSITLSLSG